MGRIPAREVFAASVAACAVASVCVAGGLAGVDAADASGGSAPQASAVGDRSLMSGSYRGVWFALPTDTTTPDGTPIGFFPGVFAASARTDTHPHTPSSVDAAAATRAARAAASQASRSQQRAALATPPPPAPAPPPAPPRPPAPPPPPPPVRQQPPAPPPQPAAGTPRDIARTMAANRGWTGAQWTCLDNLWMRESKYQTTVRNPQSGAYGIPQALPGSKMASAGADWQTNAATQISWGLNYIAGRYGSPCGAWSYWLGHYSY